MEPEGLGDGLVGLEEDALVGLAESLHGGFDVVVVYYEADFLWMPKLLICEALAVGAEGTVECV